MLIVLSGVRDNVREALHGAGIDRLIGDNHICDHISKAVVVANALARSRAAGKESTLTLA